MGKLNRILENDDSFMFDKFGEPIIKQQQAEPEKVPVKYDKTSIEPQFLYLGKMTNKKHFRAFLYGNEGKKLANNYEEYEKLVSTGVWFCSVEEHDKSKKCKKIVEKPKGNKNKDKLIGKNKDLKKEEDLDVHDEKEERDLSDEDSKKEEDHEVIEYGADC